MEIKKIDFRNSKNPKKNPKKNHSIIGVLEIPNPKYLGKIKKSVILNTPNDSHFRLKQYMARFKGLENVHSTILEDLTPLEKQMVASQELIEIRGKVSIWVI